MAVPHVSTGAPPPGPAVVVPQGSYALLGNRGEDQLRRLRSSSEVWDAGTVQHLRALGVARGWRCWEVGAGEGSIARAMANLVGRSGRVLATDFDTHFLESSAGPNLEVVRHNVAADDPPEPEFDLVHARMLLQHLPDRDEAVRRIASAVRPGGWLLLEDSDWVTFLVARPPLRELELLRDGLAWAMSTSGFDTTCGFGNVGRLSDLGFAEVGAEGRVSIMHGGSLGVAWYHVWARQLRERMVAAGHLTQAEFERANSLLDDPRSSWLSQTMIAARGRKPTPAG